MKSAKERQVYYYNLQAQELTPLKISVQVLVPDLSLSSTCLPRNGQHEHPQERPTGEINVGCSHGEKKKMRALGYYSAKVHIKTIRKEQPQACAR
ncbi:Forkhead box protein [Trichinella pseudospiralis]